MSRDPFHDLFERSAPPVASPAETQRALEAVRPGFVRARRRHRARVAAVAVTASVLLAGGAAALVSLAGDGDSTLDPTRPPATSVAGPDTPDVDRTDTVPVDSTDEAPGQDREMSESDDEIDETGDSTVGPPDDDSKSPAPDDGDHDDVAEADDEDEYDDESEYEDGEEPDEGDDGAPDPTTPTGSPSSTPAVTPGGTVVLGFDGSSIAIESVQAVPGFTAEIADADPTEVKVRFRSAEDEYEVEARVEGGQLRVDIDGTSEDDDP